MSDAQRFALIDADGVVRNIILIESADAFTPPEGWSVRPAEPGDEIAPDNIV